MKEEGTIFLVVMLLGVLAALAVLERNHGTSNCEVRAPDCKVPVRMVFSAP